MNLIADLTLRQDCFLLLELRRGVVAAFDIGAAESCKFDRLAARRQAVLLPRRAGIGFLPLVVDEALAPHPAQKRVEGAFLDAKDVGR